MLEVLLVVERCIWPGSGGAAPALGATLSRTSPLVSIDGTLQHAIGMTPSSYRVLKMAYESGVAGTEGRIN